MSHLSTCCFLRCFEHCEHSCSWSQRFCVNWVQKTLEVVILLPMLLKVSFFQNITVTLHKTILETNNSAHDFTSLLFLSCTTLIQLTAVIYNRDYEAQNTGYSQGIHWASTLMGKKGNIMDWSRAERIIVMIAHIELVQCCLGKLPGVVGHLIWIGVIW